jgi:Sigma-70, region 4
MARVSTVRRRTVAKRGIVMLHGTISQSDHEKTTAWNELRPALDEEVNRLPEKYRIPVILSYLEGRTNDEVAELLRCPVHTVRGRLSRARDLLRSRLVRRGMARSATFFVSALSQEMVFAEVVPAELVERTMKLVDEFGPRPRTLIVCSSCAQFAAESNVTGPVVTLADDDQEDPRSAGLGCAAVLTFVFISTAIGAGLTVLDTGNSSYFGALLSNLIVSFAF